MESHRPRKSEATKMQIHRDMGKSGAGDMMERCHNTKIIDNHDNKEDDDDGGGGGDHDDNNDDNNNVC